MNFNEAKAYLCSFCDGHGKTYDVYTDEEHLFDDILPPTPVSVLRPDRPEPPKNPTRKIEWA